MGEGVICRSGQRQCAGSDGNTGTDTAENSANQVPGPYATFTIVDFSYFALLFIFSLWHIEIVTICAFVGEYCSYFGMEVLQTQDEF